MIPKKIQQILNWIFCYTINKILRLFNYMIYAQLVLKINKDFSASPDYFEITFDKLKPTANKDIMAIVNQKQLFKIKL